MNIRPIKSEKDYRAAMKTIDLLWNARKGSAEADRLDVLATLVEAWEAKHFPMLPPDPIEAIKFRMEQEGLDNSDLAKIVGGRNRVSEILSKKRGLSLDMIRNLHRKLRIPAEALLAVR